MNDRPDNKRRLARLTAKSGKAEHMRQALQALEEATRHEPGCLQFEFFQALGAPAEFLLIEDFAGQQALDLHMDAAYTRAFFQAELVDKVRVYDLAERFV